MGKQKSSGILLYRTTNGSLQVLLVLPGGPFWAKKDAGAWTIPKGEFDDTEQPLQAAIREFTEETGMELHPPYIALEPVVQKAGKTVFAFAKEGNLDETTIQSNTFTMQWPPRSGKFQSFPEIAKAAWFTLAEASGKINAAQVSFLVQLQHILQAKI